MDTKAFVENTVSRALDKYLELHPAGLPVGGTKDQILAKVSADDDDVRWIDDTGRYLTEYGREYGLMPDDSPITQVIGQFIEKQGYLNKYIVPRSGCLSEVSESNDFIQGVNSKYDLYVMVNGQSTERKATPLENSTTDYSLSGTTIKLRTYIEASGEVLIFAMDGFDGLSIYSADSIRLVAREGYDFGTSGSTVPYDIRNLTGMVLDDLKVTGNAVPTDWGIAYAGTTTVTITDLTAHTPPQGTGLAPEIDISHLGFEDANDYVVVVTTKGGSANTAYGKTTYWLQNKTNTSFTVGGAVFQAKEVGQKIIADYTIFAKGFGNVTMGVNGNIPSGGSTGQVLVKKSDVDLDVEWREGGGINFEVGAEKWYGTYTEEGVTYQVYSKIVYIPALPAEAGITNVPHGVTGIKQILAVQGFCSNSMIMNAPRQNVQDNISIYQVQKGGNIAIEVGKDRSSVSAYVTIIYAKNNS